MTNNTDAARFRLLDLPQEIQDKVYAHYFLITEIRYDVQKRKFVHLPSLAIESACHKLSRDCRAIRQRVWPRKLILCHKRSSIYESVSTPADADYRLGVSRAKGILGHFDGLMFENMRIHSSWNWVTLLNKFGHLRHVEIFHNHQHIFEALEPTNHDIFDQIAVNNYEDTFQRSTDNIHCVSISTLKNLSDLLRKNSSRYSVQVICEHKVLRCRHNNQVLLHSTMKRVYEQGRDRTSLKLNFVADFDA